MVVPLWKFDMLKAADVNASDWHHKPGQSIFGNSAAQKSASFQVVGPLRSAWLKCSQGHHSTKSQQRRHFDQDYAENQLPLYIRTISFINGNKFLMYLLTEKNKINIHDLDKIFQPRRDQVVQGMFWSRDM